MGHSGGKHLLLFCPQKNDFKKVFKLPKFGQWYKKTHCFHEKVDDILDAHFVKILGHKVFFFVPMGKLRQFKNFFEIIFLGKKVVNVYLQNGPNFNFNVKKVNLEKLFFQFIFSIFFRVTPFLSALKDPQKWKIKNFGRAIHFLFSWWWKKHITFKNWWIGCWERVCGSSWFEVW